MQVSSCSDTIKEKGGSMENVRLEDICPQRAEFFLKSKEKTYALRPVTLDDYVWLQSKFGTTDITELENINVGIVCQAIYKQLEQESRKDFLATTVKEINDDGEEVEEHLKGWQVLSKNIKPDEIENIMTAYVKCLGVSKPIIDKLEEDNVKKKKK